MAPTEHTTNSGMIILPSNSGHLLFTTGICDRRSDNSPAESSLPMFFANCFGTLHGKSHLQEIDMLSTSNGVPVDVRKIFTVNADQFINDYHMDLRLSVGRERIPERIVHAKGTGAEGYFEVTHDVSMFTSADVFNGIGNKTRTRVRFSTSIPDRGGTDLLRDFKGLSAKLYTREGNLDFLYPIKFSPLVHAFKRNPVTPLYDFTQIWDFITLRPETFHTFLWLESDYGVPNGYRKMEAFPIHTYE
ncbi:Catalase [Operophtera brumata]|uniref:Catalase n=1 Tax=Operophtera brumata TaxID=104452 RepID=A0A0L7L7S9_OPEBR|nr:Catalase [Operophtera brumata]